MFHVSLLRPVIRSLLDKGEAEPSFPQAIEIEGVPAFWDRELLDSRWRQGKMRYFMDWEGYGLEEQS